MTITIRLTDLEFFAYHGVYEEERILGNTFIVNAVLTYQPISMPVIQLEQSINYEEVFQLIRKRMGQPTDLLETLVSELVLELRERFPTILLAEVAVRKKRPPVLGWKGDTEVTCSWQA